MSDDDGYGEDDFDDYGSLFFRPADTSVERNTFHELFLPGEDDFDEFDNSTGAGGDQVS